MRLPGLDACKHLDALVQGAFQSLFRDDLHLCSWHKCEEPTAFSDVRFLGNPEDICSH